MRTSSVVSRNHNHPRDSTTLKTFARIIGLPDSFFQLCLNILSNQYPDQRQELYPLFLDRIRKKMKHIHYRLDIRDQMILLIPLGLETVSDAETFRYKLRGNTHLPYGYSFPLEKLEKIQSFLLQMNIDRLHELLEMSTEYDSIPFTDHLRKCIVHLATHEDVNDFQTLLSQMVPSFHDYSDLLLHIRTSNPTRMQFLRRLCETYSPERPFLLRERVDRDTIVEIFIGGSRQTSIFLRQKTTQEKTRICTDDYKGIVICHYDLT